MADLASEKQAYKETLAKWKKKREDFEKAVKSTKAHTKSTLKRLASLSRGGGYRANGYFHIKGKATRRKAYDKTLTEIGKNLKAAGKGAQGGVQAGSSAHASLYRYDAARTYASGKRHNFLASFMPYQNEAHHLIPVEAVPGAFKGKLKLLEKLPYNINHGENIIFLPKKIRDTLIHELPQHSGSHPRYNKLVKTDLGTLSGQLTAKEEKECEPEDPPPPIAVLNKMIKFETDYWKFLVEQEGAMNINVRAEQKLADSQQADSGV